MITENGVTTEFMTLNGMVVSDYDRAGQRIEHYYYGNSQLAAEYATTETSLYYNLRNSHGDVIGLNDTYGTLTETYRYDAFGTLTSIQSLNKNDVLAETETALSRFLYAGEQLDTTTGLYYLRARQYDTEIGRFTQEDAYLGDGRNLFAYVRNNPLKYVDPSGYCSKNLGCTASTSKETTQNAWMNALNAGFTAPDSPAGMFGQYWGNRIAPTIKDDPAGSGADYAKGMLSFVPKSVWNYVGWEIQYPDLYFTGKMTTSFGMMAYSDWLINYSGVCENVCFDGGVDDNNIIKPSEIAKSWQGSDKYPGIDDYIDVTVPKGEILYRGEPNGTEYFTTLDAIEESGRDATTLFEGLQVEEHPIYGYRGEMKGFLFNEDVEAAYGITKANPQFGEGGLPQYFIPNVQDLIKERILIPVDNIKLFK